MSADSTAYLTPEFRPTVSDSAQYVSFGGAGFVYPSRRRGARGYGEGDTVRTELDLTVSDEGVVRFFVNGEAAGEAPWRGGSSAFPAISSDGGGVQCDVRGGALH